MWRVSLSRRGPPPVCWPANPTSPAPLPPPPRPRCVAGFRARETPSHLVDPLTSFHSAAAAGVKEVRVTYDKTVHVISEGTVYKPLYTIDDCIAADSFLAYGHHIVEGDFEAACRGEGVKASCVHRRTLAVFGRDVAWRSLQHRGCGVP